ncbi:DUF3298 domain-containing protein [bacterium]|nr:DUF3298 domain-containing protein [bacterium]
MFKSARFAAAVCLTLWAAASLAQAEPILQFSKHKQEYVDERRRTVYFKTSYETASLKNAKEYPALNAAVRRDFNEVRKKHVASAVRDMGPDYKEQTRNWAKYNKSKMVCFVEEEASVCRADDAVVSFSCAVTAFYGGPHHNTAILGYSFDTLSGGLLRLSDVVSDRRGLEKLVSAALKAEMEARDLEYTEETETQFRKMFDDDASGKVSLSWTLDSDGLTLYFDPYLFAPYAYGRFDMTVNYAGHEAIFAEKYLPSREDH